MSGNFQLGVPELGHLLFASTLRAEAAERALADLEGAYYALKETLSLRNDALDEKVREVLRLRIHLSEAITELAASGYCHDHPSLVVKRAALSRTASAKGEIYSPGDGNHTPERTEG